MSIAKVVRVMTGIGLLFLLPWPLARGSSGPTGDDYELSETSFARIPLNALRQGGRVSVVLTIPAGGQWERIRASWGDPGIMVFAAPDSRSIYEFSELGLEVQVRHGEASVSVQPVESSPYFRRLVAGASQSRGRQTGVTFNGAPGDDVTMTVIAARPQDLPDGELVAKYEWGLSQKDHIVAPPVEQSLRRLGQWAFGIGVTLLAGAALLASFRRDTA